MEDSNYKKFRVFLSSGFDEEGRNFANKLNHYLVDEVPFSIEKFGEVFTDCNRPPAMEREDVRAIIKNVGCFVLPLTTSCFSSFSGEGVGVGEYALSLDELRFVLKRKKREADSIRIICVTFPDYHASQNQIENLIGEDNARFITEGINISFNPDNEIEAMREIADSLLRADLNLKKMGAFQRLKNETPNVCLSFKKKTEDGKFYPLFEKLYDVTKMTFLNYASTTFVSGIDVAEVYHERDDLKRLFKAGLARGDIAIDMILTDPHSYAAQDAAENKMFPRELRIDRNRIIIHNLNLLLQFKRRYKDAKLTISLTQVALPYGVMVTEHRDPVNNHMKVDLYAGHPEFSDHPESDAFTESDDYRPSFYLLKDNMATETLYDFFSNNIKTMKKYSKDFSDGHPDIQWLLNKRIIHRAQISMDLIPHTKKAYEACLDENFPIEVDLLRLKDGTIILGRDDHDIKRYNLDGKLSDYDQSVLADICSFSPDEQLFRLEEFCDFVNDRIPVLFEIKVNSDVSEEELNPYIDEIVRVLRQSFRRSLADSDGDFNWYVQRFAIHSSVPSAIKRVKELDCMIPCGIISSNYEKLNVKDEDFVLLHKEARYMDTVHPDFLCYDIRFLDTEDGKFATQKCRDAGIPLFAWTVKDSESQRKAETDCNSDNIIIEGSISYL